jgi:hypothetical protein
MPSGFFRLCSYLLIITLLSMIGNAFSQVSIKEKVSIFPSETIIDIPSGTFGDPNNPTYLKYGGVVTFIKDPTFSKGTSMHEQSLGLIILPADPPYTIELGSFPQWHKFQFWLDWQGNTVYPNETSEDIVTDNAGLWFDLQDPLLDTTYASHWIVSLERDDDLAAMPPPEVRTFFGDPFSPSPEIEVPADGEICLVIDHVECTVPVELYSEFPTVQLLADDIRNYEYSEINLGYRNAGDVIRFYINSTHSIVAGLNLYPRYYQNYPILSYNKVFFLDMRFEDWTDLDFSDIESSLYIKPDNFADIPWVLDVQFVPPVVAPGDTADIILRKRMEDGSLLNFADETLFDVVLYSDDSDDYGTIYNADEEDTDDYFFSIRQGFKFIALNDIDEDSVYVQIYVNTSGNLLPCSVKPNSELPIIVAGRAKDTEINIDKTLSNTDENLRKKFFEQRQQKIPAVKNAADDDVVIVDPNDPNDYAEGIGEILITKPDSLDHFMVIAEPDSLLPNEIAKITIIAQNIDNKEIVLADTTRITMAADSLEYTAFIDTKGDTTFASLDSVRYSDARLGQVSLWANDDINLPDSIYTIPLSVKRIGKTESEGMSNAYIINPDSLLLITAIDTILHGDTTNVNVFMLDNNNDTLNLPNSTLLDFSLDEKGREHVNFWNSVNNIKDTTLGAISYSNVRSDRIKLIADRENPMNCDPVKINIKSSLSKNKSIYGEDRLTVQCNWPYPEGYSQCDILWGADTYDHREGATICGYGCALSCMAMAMTAFGDTVTPGELNYWMKWKENGDSIHVRKLDEGGFAGLSINWDGIFIHSNGIINGGRIFAGDWHNDAQSTSTDTLDHYLEQCKQIIIQVFNEASHERGKSGEHWVLVSGKEGDDYKILDPGRGDDYLSGYGSRFWGYVLVSKL